MSAAYFSPALPSLPPLRARLLNALVSRALPLDFAADAGTTPPAVCRLDVNGGAAAAEGGAPFASGAELFLLTGDSVWKVELSSLEALSLRPELAAWRAGSGYFYWSYKLLLDTVNEPNWIGWDAWDLGKCVDQGWFPEV